MKLEQKKNETDTKITDCNVCERPVMFRYDMIHAVLECGCSRVTYHIESTEPKGIRKEALNHAPAFT